MNKNYAKIILFAVLVILAGVTVFLKENFTPEHPSAGTETTLINFDATTIKTEVVEDTSNPAFEIKTQYPINIIGADYIKGLLAAKLDEFRKENDPAKFTAEQLEIFGPNKDRQYAFVTEYRAYGNTHFLTHRIDTYTYTGGAHGGTTAETFTYDRTGKQIQAADLFVNTAAVDTFSGLVKKHALALENYKDVINTEWLAESAGPDASNFKAFAFSGSDLIIIFQQYAIAPYAAGIIEVPIPLGELNGILKPEFLEN